MKLKSAGWLAMATVILGAGNAHANLLFDIYGGATVGMGAATTFTDRDHNHTDSAQSFGAVAGIDIPFLRVEAEYTYLNEKDMDLQLGMLNAYLKMPLAVVTPYLGAGAGMILGGHAPHGADLKKDAAYQAMLGLTFDIPVLPFKIDAEARTLYAPDVYTVADFKPDVLHYDLRLKLRYIF